MKHLSIRKNKLLSIILAASLILTSAPIAQTNINTAAAASSLCSFNFSISDGPATAKDLNDTYGTKADTGYSSGSGAMSSVSVFYASVADPETKDYKKLEWSKASDYSYNSAALPATPIIAASSNNPWGKSPFFLIKTSSKGYEALNVSFRIGASKKGPKNYKVQYSTNGSSFTDISGSSFSLSTNKTLYEQRINLPSSANNQTSLYIRIIASSTATVEGGQTTSDNKSGEIAINNISLTGTAAKQTVPTPRPSPFSQTKPTAKPTVNATARPSGSVSGSNSNNSTNNSTDTNSQSAARKIKTLKLTSYKRKSKYISGKSLKGARIHVTIGSKSYSGQVSKKGSFKIKLAKKLKKGNIIKIYATKAGYSQSKTKSYTVK